MGRTKRISFFKDPIAYEMEQKERESYLACLFQPILTEIADIPMKWLIPGLLPKGYLALLAADPKEGKTCLATALALAVAAGTPFAGLQTNQHAVLWLAGEEGPHERRLHMNKSPLALETTPFYTSYQHIPIDTEDGIDALTHWVLETHAGLIVVDPLHAATSGQSLTEGANARRSLKLLKRMCAMHEVTALVLHHAKLPAHGRQAKRVAENAQLSATASMEWVLSYRNLDPSEFPLPLAPEEEGGRGMEVPVRMERERSVRTADLGPRTPDLGPQPRLLSIVSKGRGDFANRTFHLISQSPLDYRFIDPPETQTTRKQEDRTYLENEILKLLAKSPLKTYEILEALDHSAGTLRNGLTNLRRDGYIRVVRTNGQERTYGLTKLGKKHTNEQETDEPFGSTEPNEDSSASC